jgi:hypothetical protein
VGRIDPSDEFGGKGSRLRCAGFVRGLHLPRAFVSSLSPTMPLESEGVLKWKTAVLPTPQPAGSGTRGRTGIAL